jgi:hypothetical protein
MEDEVKEKMSRECQDSKSAFEVLLSRGQRYDKSGVYVVYSDAPWATRDNPKHGYSALWVDSLDNALTASKIDGGVLGLNQITDLEVMGGDHPSPLGP